MTDKEIAKFPEKDDRDFGYRASKAGIGVIPFVGGALQEILEMAVGLPSEKRRVAWFKAIGEALQDLLKRVHELSPENLGQNEEFVSVVAKVTEIALQNHQKEKLEALRNIVINTAAGFSLDDVLRNTFLDLVDRFSPLHIEVLQLHDNPPGSSEIVSKSRTMTMGSFRHLLKAALPNCPEPVLDQIEHDLTAANLIGGGSMGMGTIQGTMSSHTTERGKTFLRFISANQ